MSTAFWDVPRTLRAPTLRVLLPVGPAGLDDGSLWQVGPRDFLPPGLRAQGCHSWCCHRHPGRERVGTVTTNGACVSLGVLDGKAVCEGCAVGQTPGGPGGDVGPLVVSGDGHREEGGPTSWLFSGWETPHESMRRWGCPQESGAQRIGVGCARSSPGVLWAEGEHSLDPTRRDLGGAGAGGLRASRWPGMRAWFL